MRVSRFNHFITIAGTAFSMLFLMSINHFKMHMELEKTKNELQIIKDMIVKNQKMTKNQPDSFKQIKPITKDKSYDSVISESTMGSCESPSLPQGSMHIVVAGYKYEFDEHFRFSSKLKDNYLWDIGLTNADVFWYRRTEPENAKRVTLTGPCGIRMHERLMLPNHGRDPAAFVDHVLEFYDKPPRTIVFLHGHGAETWHSSCNTVFSRTAYYYRGLAQSPLNKMGRVRKHMMTLTSMKNGTQDFSLNWFGDKNMKPKDDIGEPNLCPWLTDRWNKTISKRAPYKLTNEGKNPYRSCCVNFILPGKRIQRFPRKFWEDWKYFLVDQSQNDHTMGMHCFEFVIYELLGDKKTFSKEEVEKFYHEADSLGEKHIDPSVFRRVNNCKRAQMKNVHDELSAFV